ncbi:hypothetical protein ACTXT7_001658 [Hymenolepis weldensis]
MDENPGKSMRDILPKIFECLKEQKYISSRESFNACTTILKQIEASRRRGVSLVFLRPKNFHQDEKSIEEMVGGWLRGGGPTEVPTVMHVVEVSRNSDGFRVNADADADAYVETFQIIVIKPPWIDGVANEDDATSFN